MLFWTMRNNKKFCDIKSVNIDEFYHSQVGFDDQSKDGKRFKSICDKLYGIMEGKPRIVGHYIIHTFLFVDSLMDVYKKGWESDLATKLNEFDKRRKEAAEAVRNRHNTEYISYYNEYGQFTQTRSDDANNIRRRHAFFAEEMLKMLAPEKLDENRNFNDFEKEVIFFRDNEQCQFCKMNDKVHKVVWNDSEFHHVKPYKEGGKTTIENGALVHKICHPKSNANVQEFCDWWYRSADTRA